MVEVLVKTDNVIAGRGLLGLAVKFKLVRIIATLMQIFGVLEMEIALMDHVYATKAILVQIVQ